MKKLNLKDYGLSKKEDGSYQSTPKNPSVTAEQLGKVGTKLQALIVDAEERTFEGETKVMLRLTVPDLKKSEEGMSRSLGLNQTNLLSMVNAYGEDIEVWAQKAVELRVERTKFMGKEVSCIRVYPSD